MLINIENISISRDRKTVLSNVNFHADEGEFIYLTGKVGTGKSTFLKTLYAEVPVESGNAEILDYNLNKINQGISSKDSQIQNRITEFNKYFSVMSNRLYGETYLLSSQKNEKGYELIVTNLEGNPSTGKKKGQIAAFDFAYIQFADKLDIECLHFIMHDQLETIHDNQLNTIVEVANSVNGQYIVPILRDKIPSNIDISEFEVLSLSQDDKLFKI